MSISQDVVRKPHVRANQTREATRAVRPSDDNPWQTAATLVGSKIRENFVIVLLATLVCAALAGGGKLLLPAKYKATAQILIDPQTEPRPAPSSALEPQNSTLDANAAINYVESQMGVILSERVLLRTLRDRSLGSRPAIGVQEDDASARRAQELAENRALIKLQKSVTVTRAERSLLVSITVTDPDAANAAAIANAIVKAYGEVNEIDRTAAAHRNAIDLASRVEDLRKALGESQDKLQAYKKQNSLVGLNDRSIIERRVSETTDSLAAAERADVQARARLKQLEASPNDIGAVAAFGSDPESRQLQVLIVGRAATAAEAEQLESTLGERHPALIAAKARLRDYNKRINANLEGLRRTARAQIAEAQTQVAANKRRLAAAANEMEKIKQADPSLRQLEDTVEAKRKALTELELRQRLGETGGVAAGGFRIVSPARVPPVEGKTVSAALWCILGAMIGVALSIAGLAFRVIFDNTAITAAPLTSCDADAATNSPASEKLDFPDEYPVIASLPMIAPRRDLRALNGAEAQTEVWRRPTSSYALEVASIFERLRHSCERLNPLSVLIAGTTPRCGVSTLAANLARTAAMQGERVLLIDAHHEHPTLDLTITSDAPKTLIRLANRWRPLFRLQPYEHSLNLIPSLDNEDHVCHFISEESEYQIIDGIFGNFDFVVFDGPDISKISQLKALIHAADIFLLVVPGSAEHIVQGQLLMRLLSAKPGQFAGCVGSALVDVDEAA